MSCMNLQKNQQNSLLFVGFNQDHGCFACGTTSGFKVYSCDPFRETFSRSFNEGGIGYVEMLFRCNILALVGGGKEPRYPLNKVILWDDFQNRCIGELSYRSDVKAVKLRKDAIVVVLQNKVYVYSISDLKVIDSIDTADNERGLCALCPSPKAPVLVCPGLQKGQIRVDLYAQKRTQVISAHEGEVVCIALSHCGTRVATASEKGTLIRVFDTGTGRMLQELRRGTEKAEIYSIAFNRTGQWLAVSSDRGTVHIFKLDAGAPEPDALAKALGTDASSSSSGESALSGTGSESKSTDLASAPLADAASSSSTAAATSSTTQSAATASSAASTASGAAEAKNPRSWLSALAPLLPSYVKSEWSFSQFRVPSGRTVVAFGSEPYSVVVVCADGTYFKAKFDPTKPGAEAVQESYSRFLTQAEE